MGQWIDPLSFKYLDIAWQVDCKRAAAKLVLISLADHANEGGGCFPSVARISKRCNLDRRTVQRQLRALETLGFIKSKGKTGTSSDYELTLRPIDAPPASIRRPLLRHSDAPSSVITPPKPSVEPPVKPKDKGKSAPFILSSKKLSGVERISLEKERDRLDREREVLRKDDFKTDMEKARLATIKARMAAIDKATHIELPT